MTETMADGKANPVLAEVWRGPVLECVHRGSAVAVDADGNVEAAWGNPDRVMLPRSACKMLQALPLVESGAAEAAGLTDAHLALACASHDGAQLHVDLVQAWLATLGLGDDALRCGGHPPLSAAARHALRASGEPVCQAHDQCSGKHTGFLTFNRHLGGGPEYVDPDHPVQRAVRAATEEMAGETSPGHATDGCSAPNFALTLRGFATALARFARPEAALSGARAHAALSLRNAMIAHPVLVAGEGRSCTALLRACAGRAAVKTGAEGVFAAILPERGLGIAVKIDDGSERGRHAAIAALLARYGALDRAHPAYAAYADAPLPNRRGIDCGRIRAADCLAA